MEVMNNVRGNLQNSLRGFRQRPFASDCIVLKSCVYSTSDRKVNSHRSLCIFNARRNPTYTIWQSKLDVARHHIAPAANEGYLFGLKRQYMRSRRSRSVLRFVVFSVQPRINLDLRRKRREATCLRNNLVAHHNVIFSASSTPVHGDRMETLLSSRRICSVVHLLDHLDHLSRRHDADVSRADPATSSRHGLYSVCMASYVARIALVEGCLQ